MAEKKHTHTQVKSPPSDHCAMNPNSLENGVGDQSNRNHIPVSALDPGRYAIITTRIELSNNIRMRSNLFFNPKENILPR